MPFAAFPCRLSQRTRRRRGHHLLRFAKPFNANGLGERWRLNKGGLSVGACVQRGRAAVHHQGECKLCGESRDALETFPIVTLRGGIVYVHAAVLLPFPASVRVVVWPSAVPLALAGDQLAYSN